MEKKLLYFIIIIIIKMYDPRQGCRIRWSKTFLIVSKIKIFKEFSFGSPFSLNIRSCNFFDKILFEIKKTNLT